ncbi:uncharacterized protein LOC144221355 [Crocuta crocuta]
MAWRPYDSGDEMNLDETKVPLGDGKAWGCTEWAVSWLPALNRLLGKPEPWGVLPGYLGAGAAAAPPWWAPHRLCRSQALVPTGGRDRQVAKMCVYSGHILRPNPTPGVKESGHEQETSANQLAYDPKAVLSLVTQQFLCGSARQTPNHAVASGWESLLRRQWWADTASPEAQKSPKRKVGAVEKVEEEKEISQVPSADSVTLMVAFIPSLLL